MKKLPFFEYWVFLRAVFCTEQLKNDCRVFFSMFLTQSANFAKAIAFALWPILAVMKKLPFFEYWVFLRAVFYTEQLKNDCRVFFSMFLRILNFDPKCQFCKGYSLCIVANFGRDEKLPFFEYWVFLRAVFCTEQLKNDCRVFFSMFLRILNFDPKCQFCKGYSLCIVANFGRDEKVAIFRILGVFESRFLTQNSLKTIVECFLACFWEF